ncbi:MAG TPA: hypothetical protein VJT82_09470 [Pyrinomonadaceae bacterium]|nr:hypothetical protein [Pyrinomonadaceae bacterium]
MKELADGLAQLVAIIMIMITLAVSTAALSQWASSDTNPNDRTVQQTETRAAPTMSASLAP